MPTIAGRADDGLIAAEVKVTTAALHAFIAVAAKTADTDPIANQGRAAAVPRDAQFRCRSHSPTDAACLNQ
jgi:hypothetical protein